ncbi:MAG: lamin tail domain-containing protein [Dehalococcoidia bacterium]|nr:lamin tail domain-containing protein [Dehalococcoidia bacterium]
MKSNFFHPATGLTILLVAGLFVACGGASQSDIGQEAAPTTVTTANPSPTTASSFALRGDTPTEIPAVTSDQLLRIAEVPPDLPPYDRNDWKHWVDEDKDCQNTRHEVLIEESLAKVAFKTDRKCQVATGEWFDPYTGETVTDATRLDIDHMIPLKNAHDSGGWAWDKSRKAAFANEMSYADHLIAVTASANRKKGARGPEEWKPTNRGYWCDYAIDWVQIKIDWDLSATKAERGALQEMLETCDSTPSIPAVSPKAESPTTVKEAVPPAAASSNSLDVRIASIDCKGKPEVVTIENSGASTRDMTGWKVSDDGLGHTFNFPNGFLLRPGSSMKLVTGGSGQDTESAIYWKTRTVWNNDGDTARLFDPSGETVSERECP